MGKRRGKAVERNEGTLTNPSYPTERGTRGREIARLAQRVTRGR